MKKLLLIVCLLPIFFSFKKEKETPQPTPIAVDERDKFIGNYSGNRIWKYDGKEIVQTLNTTILYSKDDTYKLVFDGLYGNPNGNTFLTEQFSKDTTIDNSVYVMIVSPGTLALNGKSLVGIIPVTFTGNNQIVKGTINYNLAKK